MNSQTNHKDDLLSSWKEVADYLNTKPRTCIRWEKTLGLPIHRLEGVPRSRIYAYKHELDAWLAAKLKNGSAAGTPPGKVRGPLKRRRALIAVPLVVIAAAVALILFKPGPKAPSPVVPASPDGVPRSTGPLDFYPGDIITSEFLPEGKLRVWRMKNATTYFESWRMAPLRHTSLAIGDLDGDPDPEIVAPGYCREFAEEGGRRSSSIRFFLNAYKRGAGDWWKTTFYDKAQCVSEAEDYESTQIDIGNIDRRPGNEIVLITAHGLSAYRYDPAEGAIKILSQRTSFLDQAALRLRALALADLDGDRVQEILVLGNEWRDGVEADNGGRLIVLKWGEQGPEIADTVVLEGGVSSQSLRMGDVVPGDGPEAVFPVYRRADGIWHIALKGWNRKAGFVFEAALGRDETDPYRPVHLDLGDIMDRAGDEIVVARSGPNELQCHFWNGERLVPGAKYALTPKAKLANLFVNTAGEPGRRSGRVLICGEAKGTGGPGGFYVEVVDYSDGFIPVWLRAGGDETEIKVSYALFGR